MKEEEYISVKFYACYAITILVALKLLHFKDHPNSVCVQMEPNGPAKIHLVAFVLSQNYRPDCYGPLGTPYRDR